MQNVSYKWLVTIVVIFGMFMVLLDTTIVNTAIPHLQTTFGAPLADVNWVATGYTLAEGIGIPLMPFFAALMGNKRFYIIILILFTIGSALCGVAWNLSALIVFRILQGLAGASMLPLSITLLFSEFPPEERGVAMGALGLPLMAAPALGPTVGGYIVTYVDWRMLFYINVPIGIIGSILAVMFLRDIRTPRNRPLFFDIPGFAACSIGLGALLYALDKAGSDGWGSLTVVGFMTLGVILLIAFIFIELITIENGKDPLLDIRIFKSRTFTGGNISLALLVFALFGGQFLIPLYLQNLRGLSAYDAGLILLPQALGSMVSSVLGGRLVDKLGMKQVVIPGLILLGGALWGLSRLTLDTPFADFQLLLILRGLALGFTMQPVSAAALSEIKPALLSQASSLNSVVRSMFSAVAVALVSTLVTNRTTFHYQHLAEAVTPDSAPGQGLQQTAAVLMGQGMAQQIALFAAMGQLVKQLKLQSYMLAMNDTFLLTLGAIFLTGFVVLFVVRAPRKAAGGARSAVALEHMPEEIPSMEEEPVGAVPSMEEERVAEPVGAVASTQQKSESAFASSPPVPVRRSSSATLTNQQSTPSHLNKRNALMPEQRKDTRMRRFMRPSVLIPSILLAVILIAGVVGYLLYNSYNFYSTDDAQVAGTMVNLVPPTNGTLIVLNVEVGSYVKANQDLGTVKPTGLLPVQHIFAPRTGLIVQVPAVVGQLVSTATTIAQEVDPSSIKVTANVEESAIKNIMVGQQVDIHVDAYNSNITGHVSQIVGATAGQFSLLPSTDNSSGNYTKVSQRIPVYVKLDEPYDGSLAPGMSVEVTIHLH
jgi:EmrB/QacA subfamily drug resistance transporter